MAGTAQLYRPSKGPNVMSNDNKTCTYLVSFKEQ